MAKTPAERMEELSEELRKLTDVDEQLVKLEEKKVTEARKVKTQLEGFDNLGKQLKDSLLAPLKSLANAIPEPLKILGKMAIKPLAVPFLKSKIPSPEAAKRADDPSGFRQFSVGGAMGEAAGREISQKGFYGGMMETGMGFIPDWMKTKGAKLKKAEHGTIPRKPLFVRDLGTHSRLNTLIGILGIKKSPAKIREEELEKEAEGVEAAEGGGTTIKKKGFLRALLGGLLGGALATGRLAGIMAGIGGIFVAAGTALLAGIGVVFAGLKALAILALPVAIIVWGVYSAMKVVQDYIEGFSEGGLTGGIAQALGGSGSGLLNAAKQGSKWAGIGAMIGLFTPLGPVGAIAGAIIGGALGAIFGYFGGEKLKEWMDKAGVAVGTGC